MVLPGHALRYRWPVPDVLDTLYGRRIYWIFGGVLAVAGAGLVLLRAPAFAGALTGALVEYAFGAIVFITHKSATNLTNRS